MVYEDYVRHLRGCRQHISVAADEAKRFAGQSARAGGRRRCHLLFGARGTFLRVRVCHPPTPFLATGRCGIRRAECRGGMCRLREDTAVALSTEAIPQF